MTKKKKVIAVVAVIMAVLLGLGVFLGLYLTRNRGVHIDHGQQMRVTHGTGKGMSLMSAEVEPKNGSDTSITFTATVTPENALDAVLDWTIEWGEVTGSWGSITSHDNVSDYLTLTPTSDGAMTATLACRGEFGTQAIVKASIRRNAEVFATATVDYVQKELSHTVIAAGAAVTEGENTIPFQYDPSNGNKSSYQYTATMSNAYTIANPIEGIMIAVTPTNMYKEALRAAGITPGASDTIDLYSGTSTSGQLDFFLLGEESRTEEQMTKMKIMLLKNIDTPIFELIFKVKYKEETKNKTLVYPIKLSASSIGELAQDITLDKTEIRF